MASPAPAPSNPLLASTEREALAHTLRHVLGVQLDAATKELPVALHGSDAAVRRYVAAYREVTAALLVHAELSTAPSVLGESLAGGAVEFPFSPWAAHAPMAEAIGFDLVSRLRAAIGLAALKPPVAPLVLEVDDLAARRFLRRARAHLSHPEEAALPRLMEQLGVSKSELGRLFGVSRQAIDGWLEHGVPAERQEKLGTLLALVDLLERRLKAGRVPGAARRPAKAWGGETMLELIADDRHRELLASVRGSLDFSAGA